ncbi:hypothetical protein [Actinoplanes sp. NPDC026670]|uniref:hypothetical protein n=1 Tax=Actinoplanes sp. NPDC026670 TaxID=3154700 RepID=UPI0033DCEC33
MTAERLAADFEVDLERARRALDEFESFERQPASALAVDGSALFTEPGFWAYHLSSSGKDVAALEAVFGLPEAQWLRPFHTGVWPTFTITLPSGGAALVVYRTDAMVTLEPGCVVGPHTEYMVDFWLAPGDGGPGMTLAQLSGHWFGPGLRWAELQAIARDALPDRLAAARRLLLLTPFLGDAAAGDEAADHLAEALALVSGRDRLSAEVPTLAGILVDRSSEPEWRLWNDVWVNDEYYCMRSSPDREDRNHPWPVEQLRRVDVALAPGHEA